MKAFTILELLMVMVLAALVAGMAYSAWNIMDKGFIDFSENSDRLLDGTSFVAFIERDFSHARKISVYDGRLLLEGDDHSLEYLFEESGTIRKGYKDGNISPVPSSVIISGMDSYFQGNPVNEGMIDFCELRFMVLGKENVITLQKEYASDDLIRQQEYVD